MDFSDASMVEAVCYSIRLSDWPRAKNRTRIQNLFNGVQPFNEADAEANGIKINVNPLTGTVLAHDARAQFYNAFLRPGRFFDMKTDNGPQHKLVNWSNIVTQQMNRKMKRSMPYFETFRSKFAMNVIHGIGPSSWKDADGWAPNAVGIEDVGIPSNTLLTMENLPFFYLYRSFTVPELMKLVNRKNVDKSWNLPLVKKLMKQVDQDSQALMNSNWPEVWSPEKTAERIKGDGGFYSSDQVQTINCFDFYFWNDRDGEEGWNRRMIMDPWSEPALDGRMEYDRKKEFSRGAFLFNSGNRKYADKLSQLMAFQFADLSAIAPFRYHSVRSLGFLVYGVCHLQNRMFCRFNEAAFEAAMNYLRINSPDDADRALKIDLINRGLIDKSVQFVPQAERWQVNTQLLEAAMGENRRVIESNSNSWTQQGADSSGGGDARKTKFQAMAEIQQTTALVQSAFNQAYRYQEGEYTEIARRFFRKDSKDIDVREFQAACLHGGVPEKLFNVDCWDIVPTQTMGDGNKTMEMAISEQLLGMRNLFDPEPQRDILRKVTFSLTGNAKEAESWVPETPAPVSDSMHDAQLATAALMMGLPVTLKTGMDHKEYAITLIGNLMLEIQKASKTGMATADQIQGYTAIAQAAGQHLQILAQDKSEKEFVNKANQQIGKLMNMVKAFAQRLQQQQQKAQEQNGGMKPEDKAKIQALQATTQAKLQGKKQSDVQKQAHVQVKFEAEEARKQQQFELDQARENMKALHEVARGRMKSAGDE